MNYRILFALAVCLLCTGLGFAQTAATTGPKIKIAATEHNLGEIKRGTEAKHTYIFKNEGTADLEIKNVAPS